MIETIKRTMEAESLFKNNGVFNKYYSEDIDTYGKDVVTIGCFDIVRTKESDEKYYFDIYIIVQLMVYLQWMEKLSKLKKSVILMRSIS